MIFIYVLIAASACSLYYALRDIGRTLVMDITPDDDDDPDFPVGARVRVPKIPPNGSFDAFAIPEVDGSDSSGIP